jgi:hypothetical protein
MLYIALLLYITIAIIINSFIILGVFNIKPESYLVLFVVIIVSSKIMITYIVNFQKEFLFTLNNILSKKKTSKVDISVFAICFLVIIYSVIFSSFNYVLLSIYLPVGAILFLTASSGNKLPAILDIDEAQWVVPDLSYLDESNESDTENESNQEFRNDTYFDKDFRFKHGNKNYSIKIKIRRDVYDEFLKRQRVDYSLWANEYVTNGIVPEIKMLAYEIMKCGKPKNNFEEVDLVLSLTQQIIKYENDADYYPNAIRQGEYPKYPIESLVEQTGDCEDSAILCAALLKSMGYECALIFIPGHCALGVGGIDGLDGVYIEHNKHRYFYCETTGEGWQIGILPNGCSVSDATVQPIPGLNIQKTVHN